MKFKLIFSLLVLPFLCHAQGKITRPIGQNNPQEIMPKTNCTTVVTMGSSNGHDWVDLGLPSGTLWAKCNYGASSVHDSGYYLSWGGLDIPMDNMYTPENSMLFEKKIGDISGNSTYDVVRKNWGGRWRMPTKTDFLELAKYCKCEVRIENGVKGAKILGPNGNSIFIPNNSVKRNGSISEADDVTLWLATSSETEWADVLTCGGDTWGFKTSGNLHKFVGCPIRPVLSK